MLLFWSWMTQHKTAVQRSPPLGPDI